MKHDQKSTFRFYLIQTKVFFLFELILTKVKILSKFLKRGVQFNWNHADANGSTIQN